MKITQSVKRIKEGIYEITTKNQMSSKQIFQFWNTHQTIVSRMRADINRKQGEKKNLGKILEQIKRKVHDEYLTIPETKKQVQVFERDRDMIEDAMKGDKEIEKMQKKLAEQLEKQQEMMRKRQEELEKQREKLKEKEVKKMDGETKVEEKPAEAAIKDEPEAEEKEAVAEEEKKEEEIDAEKEEEKPAEKEIEEKKELETGEMPSPATEGEKKEEEE